MGTVRRQGRARDAEPADGRARCFRRQERDYHRPEVSKGVTTLVAQLRALRISRTIISDTIYNPTHIESRLTGR